MERLNRIAEGFVFGVLTAILFLLLISCAPLSLHRYPPVPMEVDQQWVLRQLGRMRDSHVRLRGEFNTPEFDDYSVERYNRIMRWIENNT